LRDATSEIPLPANRQSRKRHLEIEGAVSNLKVKESKVALDMLATYVDRAVEQWNRINDDEQTASEVNLQSRLYESRGDKTKQDEHKIEFWTIKRQELVDLHLYAICADKVGELMRIIVKKEDSQDLAEFWKRWAKTFKMIYDLRVRFENPHTYLQKGWNEAYFGLFLGVGEFSVTSTKFNLAKIGIENITTFFDELIQHLRGES
jgi:hypothetical protein